MPARKPRKGDHVVAGPEPNRWTCLHCGAKYLMRLPASPDVFVAACKEFANVHKNCRAQVPTKS